MKAIQEIREERNDVYSLWENKPTIVDGQIEQVETKLEEVTVAELEKRITDFEKQIEDINVKIELEKSKIILIEELN
jgi:uncharacterized protein YydD (DUF2326 family)